MRVSSVAEVRQLDRRAVEEFGITTETSCHPCANRNIFGYDSINLVSYIDWEEV